MKLYPQKGKIGKIIIGETTEIHEVEKHISKMGYRLAKAGEIKPDDAEDTPHILVALGEEVPHPQTKEPSYKGLNKKGETIHLFKKIRTLQPNVEIAILEAA